MQNQSMRKRPTTLGEPPQKSGSSSSFLAAPAPSTAPAINVVASPPGRGAPPGATSVGRHIRSFSRISTRGPPMGLNFTSTSNTSLGVPGTSLADTSAVSDAISVSSHGNADDEFDAALVVGSVDPEKFLARALANANAADVLKYGERLRSQALSAQDFDQRKLQHNHKLLSTVATSIAKLAPAVAVLHKQVADLSLVSDAMRQDAFAAQTASQAAGAGNGLGAGGAGGAGHDGTPRRLSAASFNGESEDLFGAEDPATAGLGAVPFDRRQSMLVLNSAWTNDLNELYRRVDGAQRVLPPAPGRHVVHEENNWSELNLVTQKPVRPVLIVALNDFLLVAAPRQGRFAHAYHLPLDDKLECSIDDSARSLKVTHETTQIGLHAPSLARLRLVYSELCKLMELAVTRRRTAVRGSSMRPRSALASEKIAGGPTMSSPIPSGGGRNTRGKSIYQQHARKPSHASLASVPEISVEQRREAARIIADLDRCIAHRSWAEATRQVLENEDDSLVGPLVLDRRELLAENMLAELKDKRMLHSCPDKCLVVQQLSQLGRARDAKHALLNTAASEIETQARNVHFMGDVVNYISQMAAIYFQTIIATVQVYQKAFPAKADSSFVVSWVKSQVDLYAAIFNRQLFRIAPEFRAYQRCREVSRLESSQLRDLNMDMEFMLRYVWES